MTLATQIGLAIIAVIGFVATIKALWISIHIIEKDAATRQYQNQITILHERKALRDKLIDIMTLPLNYPPNYMRRRIQPMSMKYTEPTYGLDDNLGNQSQGYYRSVLNDLQDLKSDISVYFPTLLSQYKDFIDNAQSVVSSIIFHETGEIKHYDLDLAKETENLFQEIIDQMNILMQV